MDDIVIDYLMYAISLVLVISLLSYSILNHKASTQNVVNSSQHLEIAKQDYSLGAYTKEGYYISGKSINTLYAADGTTAVVLKTKDGYFWVYKPNIAKSKNEYTFKGLQSDSGSVETVIINSDDVSINADEVYRVSSYRADIWGRELIFYVLA